MLQWDRYDIDKDIETTVIIKFWYNGKYRPATFESEAEQPELCYEIEGMDADLVTPEEHAMICDAIYKGLVRIASIVDKEVAL